MVKKIVLSLVAVLLVVVGGIAIAASLQSEIFHLEAATTTSAPPEQPFALVNDFHHWADWSPWAKVDPKMKVTYRGADAGEGAIYEWDGNSDIGAGRMTILESEPHDHIRIKLEFLKPFEATSTATFTFKPEGDGTRIIWAMDGKNDFMGKVMSLFIRMDDLVLPDFHKGLANIKSLVDEPRPQAASVPE